MLRTAVKIDGQTLAVDQPPPQLGRHTHQILKELGYDDAQIAALKAEGAA